MRVLVVYASKYGATADIAQSVASAIRTGLRPTVAPREAGEQASAPSVEVHDAEHAPPPDEFDAAVVGSAVYLGRWIKSVRRYVDRHAATLAAMPLWLFSSGPVGGPDRPHEPPADIDEVTAVMTVRGTAVFAGKLDRDALNLAERAVVLTLRAPVGDFRDWDAIHAWGTGIADSLLARQSDPT